MKRAASERAVKRAISLPQALDATLAALARSEGRTYSGLVREAVQGYLAARDVSSMEDAYSRHYSKEGRRSADSGLARDLGRASLRDWP